MKVAIGNYASHAGIEPDLAAGHVAITVTELSKQANALAADMGIKDMQAFNEYSASAFRDTLPNVVRNHLLYGNTRQAWSPVMNAYKARGGK
jgi:hypothetical protein